MAYEAALVMVNSLQRQLADLARTIVTALDDDKVSVGEGLQLGMKGMLMATSIGAVLQGSAPHERREVLEVLEHGEWTMPPVPEVVMGDAPVA